MSSGDNALSQSGGVAGEMSRIQTLVARSYAEAGFVPVLDNVVIVTKGPSSATLLHNTATSHRRLIVPC